jgi:hypothetical protein
MTSHQGEERDESHGDCQATMNSEAGILPDEKLLIEMGEYIRHTMF